MASTVVMDARVSLNGVYIVIVYIPVKPQAI
ncbi:hypothetical protein GQX74_000984 [Glossina fuscipes]|uniref:Uncharacterized protein n=1 Tax=Glossina palpalis gambiensis TaxID=67801 RepID=A0A1B0C5M0_9MUSC|nr:hypothetical protein GQX74_000984 [Glossina fuscipes]